MKKERRGLTNVLSVKRIHPHQGTCCKGSKTPFGNLSNNGELPLMDIIDSASIEADVTVDNETDGKNSIDNGICRS
jgi:hypothetical protein